MLMKFLILVRSFIKWNCSKICRIQGRLSSESSLDSADLTAVPLDERTHQYEKLHQHPHHSHTDPRSHHNKDGWHSHAHKHNHAAFYADYELHLPSGRTAGHR